MNSKQLISNLSILLSHKLDAEYGNRCLTVSELEGLKHWFMTTLDAGIMFNKITFPVMVKCSTCSKTFFYNGATLPKGWGFINSERLRVEFVCPGCKEKGERKGNIFRRIFR